MHRVKRQLLKKNFKIFKIIKHFKDNVLPVVYTLLAVFVYILLLHWDIIELWQYSR